MFLYSPRRSWHSGMMLPTNSCGVMIDTFTNGSSATSMDAGFG